MASVLGQAIERTAADAKLRNRERQQRAIANLGRLVLNSVDTDVLEKAAELLIEASDADFGFINGLTAEGTIRLLAGRCWSDDIPREIALQAHRQAGSAILTGEPAVVDDYRTETRFATREWTVPYGILSGVTVPVASARHTFGVLSAQSRRAGHFRQEDIAFLQQMANVLAEAMEREQTREAVEKSEQRYRRIFEGAREIIFTIDSEGRFVTLNPAFAAISEWSSEEWLGRPFQELVVPEDRARVTGVFDEILANAEPVSNELTMLGRNRKVMLAVQSFATIENGRVTEVYGFARDITEARQVARERERVMRNLHLLLESTVEGIYTIDLDGNCTMVNRAAAAFLDFTQEELIGYRLHDLLHATKGDGTRLEVHDCPILTVLRTGAPTSINNDVFSRRDGSEFPVAYSAAPIIDAGTLVGAVVTFTDLTERRKLEAKLEQANRLSSLGRLAAMVAHEFNNVLMGIAPFLDVIRRAQSPQKITTALDHIAGAVKRGRRVTQDILRFTQPGEPVLAPLEVVGWLESVVLEARSLIGPHYTITVGAVPLVVEADAGQLHQIFMNLILNARDAMPAGGTIHLEAREEHDDARFAFGVVENPGRYAHLLVRDTGTGMSEETLRYAFEPLFTTKNNGTGLGLAVTHQVVRRHGGEIFIESTPGTGTTFHVFLPLSAREPAADVVETVRQWSHQQVPCVLLVEDDCTVAAGLTAILETEGFDVTVADTGSRALELVQARKPDAVILDVGLPDCDGRTIYARIAELHPGLPVVFSTGHTERSRVEAFLSRPNVGYLFKPYDSNALMEELTRTMAAAVN
jgi:PAS domain S-box-containing protein